MEITNPLYGTLFPCVMDNTFYSVNDDHEAHVFDSYPDYYEVEEYKLPDDGFFDIVTIGGEEDTRSLPDTEQNNNYYTRKKEGMNVIIPTNPGPEFGVCLRKGSRSGSMSSPGGKRIAPPKPPRMSRSDSTTSTGSGSGFGGGGGSNLSLNSNNSSGTGAANADPRYVLRNLFMPSSNSIISP
jgi:hypothetical protein